MKTITVSVADELYQRASQKAAGEATSLSQIVQGFLVDWTGSADQADSCECSQPEVTATGPEPRGESSLRSTNDRRDANERLVVTAEARRGEAFLRFLDELNAKPRQPGPSVGPLNREELYQRGISGH